MFPVVAVLGVQEILIVVLVILLLFGATKIPELARNLGRAKSELKRGEREGQRAIEREEDEERVRQEARELGIPVEGKSIEELRREITSRRASP